MNVELQKIENALNRNFTKYTFSKLSEDRNGSPLVADTNLAYCFDDISNSYYRIKHCSCDCLLLREKLYLIEFKRIAYTSDSKLYKIRKQNLALKISESLHTIEKKIFNILGIDTSKFEKVFILVVDSRTSPVDALIGAMASLSRSALSTSWIHDDSTLLESLSKYGIADRAGNFTYFHMTKIINEINFSSEIATMI